MISPNAAVSHDRIEDMRIDEENTKHLPLPLGEGQGRGRL